MSEGIDVKSTLLEGKSRLERLREMKGMVDKGVKFSAFDLAVLYDISINVVYRDVKALKDEGLIPKDFKFTKKEAFTS